MTNQGAICTNADQISVLPAEILQLIVGKVTADGDLKSLIQVSKRIREAVLPKFWHTVQLKPRRVPGHPYLLHELPLLCPSPSSSQYIRHLHFRADFDSPNLGRCNGGGTRCPHGRWETAFENDNDVVTSGSSSESDDNERHFYTKHPRDFDHLSFAGGMIVNRLYDNQLLSFSWHLGTCIPGGILGPEGIIASRQKSLQAICLTTDPHCSRGEMDMYPYPCLHRSVIKLDNFRNLKILRWRAPHCEDIQTLSSVITGNRGHLQNLELDFIDWDEVVGYYPQDEDGCPFSKAILQMPPNASSHLFPQLQELSLSNTDIGPQLAQALNFDSLTLLKLDNCSGWSSFMTKVVEMKVIPKIKRLEIFDTESATTNVENQRAVVHFIGTFAGLENLYLHFCESWDPDSTFWIGMAGHRKTLKRCILDGLWKGGLQRNTLLQTVFHRFASNPSSNPISLLNTECLGLYNEPTYLKPILLPFTLKTFHIREGSSPGEFEWSWVWEEVGKSECQVKGKAAIGCTTNLRGLLKDLRYQGSLGFGKRFQLQPRFCAFIEWAFGPGGIPSLRIIAVGDFSIGYTQPESRFSIYRTEEGAYTIRNERDGRLDRDLEDYREFLESCATVNLVSSSF